MKNYELDMYSLENRKKTMYDNEIKADSNKLINLFNLEIPKINDHQFVNKSERSNNVVKNNYNFNSERISPNINVVFITDKTENNLDGLNNANNIKSH